MINTNRIARGLLDWMQDSRPVVDRATLLPIGQYEDGSVTFAWPGFLKDAWEGAQRSYLDAGRVPVPDAPQGTRWSDDLDAFNAASVAPMGGVAGRAVGFAKGGVGIPMRQDQYVALRPGTFRSATTGEALFANDANASLPALAVNALENSRGIRAFHGSPHDFDRFDMSKIGTGEGAQAYGHGLYFAESEGVARSYRDALAKPANAETSKAAANMVRDAYDRSGGDWTKARARVQELKRAYASRWGMAEHELPLGHVYDQAVADISRAISDPSFDPLASSGRMYEVRINAEPEQFLHWDKSLGEQNDAVRALAQSRHLPDETPAQMLVRWMENDLGDQRHKLPQRMREAGIPGIRYLDRGSREAGEGTYNYVVFDDSLVDILRKYANAETASLPALFDYATPPGGLLAPPEEPPLPGLLAYGEPFTPQHIPRPDPAQGPFYVPNAWDFMYELDR